MMMLVSQKLWEVNRNWFLYQHAHGCKMNWLPNHSMSLDSFRVQRLNLVVDSEHGGVLGQIADPMYECEGPIAEQLELKEADTAAIKTEHPNNLRLKTCEHSAYLIEIEPCSTKPIVTMDIWNSNGPKCE